MPSAPPEHLTTLNKTSTSIEVSWSPIPSEFINTAQLLGYTVLWWKVNDSVYVTWTGEPRVWLADLEEYTEYNITVSAMNNIGSGPNSSIFTVRTEEEGKKVYAHAVLWPTADFLARYTLLPRERHSLGREANVGAAICFIS